MIRAFLLIIFPLFSFCWAGPITFDEAIASHPDHQEALEEALERLGLDRQNVRLEKLEGGLSRVVLYQMNEELVFRLLPKKHEVERRLREIAGHRAGAGVGLAPKLLFVDEERLLVVMPFVKGHLIGPKDLESPQILHQLGEGIARLQALKEYPSGSNHMTRMEHHYQRALEYRAPVPSAFYSDYEVIWEEGIELLKGALPAHGDLHSSNVLVTDEGRVMVIDWAGAGYDEPYYDLGLLSCTCGLNDEQRTWLLNGYFGRMPTRGELATLHRSETRVTFFTALIWFDCAGRPDGREMPPLPGTKLDQLLVDPNLRLARDYLAAGEVISPRDPDPKRVQLFALGLYKAYQLKVEASAKEEAAKSKVLTSALPAVGACEACSA